MGNSVVFSKSDNADIRRVVYVPKYDAEVEYLQSSGTQYIDTGIIPNSEHKYEVTVSKTADNTAEVVPLGSWNAWQNAMFGSDIKNSTVGIYLLWGGGSHQTNIITNDWITLYGEKGLSKATLISTGEILAAGQFSATFTCNQSAYLFALNRNGSVAYRGSCKISRAKIWNGDTLVRDFIPVRVGSVGYMYDKVSGKLFRNQGTGNFILGQDVAKPIVKRYVVPMPYDRRVEYLESTGTQYIDLDYMCSANTIASVTVLPTQSKTQQRFIGSSSAYFEIYQNNNGYYGFTSNDNIHTTIVTFQSTTKVNLTTKRKLTINNVISKGIVDSIRTEIYKNTKFGRLYLLTRPFYHPERAAVCRLYAASITDGDFKMDLIPVRKNGIGYMYDRVSGKLFGNAGTGQFILGQDI